MTKYRSLASLAALCLVACGGATHHPKQTDSGTVNSCNETGCPLPQDHAKEVITTTNDDPFVASKKDNKNCPDDMVEVDGDYCPNLQTECLYNVDANGKRINKPASLLWACGEYKHPTKCLSKNSELIHMHFCIDRYEWPNKPEQIPQDWMSWFEAKKAVEAVGKRLCTDREWTLAAEGPDRRPYPFGDGYHRDSTACNFDNHMPKDIDVFLAKKSNDAMSQKLRNLLVPSGSKLRCVSDYGVYDMAGNIDEWIVNLGGTDCTNRSSGNCISGLKGGHIWSVRNASRPETTAHGQNFAWYESGSRACADIAK